MAVKHILRSTWIVSLAIAVIGNLSGCGRQSDTRGPAGTTAVADSASDNEIQTRHVRLAIVSAVEARHSPYEDLLLAEASELGGVDFLERADLAKVLDEQKLTAASLTSAETAIRLGQLLSADALVLIESDAGAAARGVRMRIVESRSGVRLLDCPLSAVTDESQRKYLLAELRRCVTKLRSPAAQRCYVAVVGFRSEESSSALEAEARILGVLLEQDLALLPHVVMLERSQVRHLTAEQVLAGLNAQMRAASLAVEGEVRRDSDGGHLVVTIAITVPGSPKPKVATVRIARDDLIGGRRPIVASVTAALHNQPMVPTPSNPVDEADLLCARAAVLRAQRSFLEAGALCEAAYALDPTLARYAMGRKCYEDCALDFLQPQCDRLRASLRGHRLAEQYLERHLGKDPELGEATGLIYFPPTYVLLYARALVGAIDSDPSAKVESYYGPGDNMYYCGVEPGADAAEVMSLRREIHRVQQAKWDRVYSLRRQRNERVDNLLLARLACSFWSPTPEEAKDEVLAAMAAIDQEEAAGGPLNAQGQIRMGLFWSLSLADRYTMLTAAVHGMALERWRAERLLPLWDWMSGHRDPAVRIIGLYGRAWLQGAAGKKAKQELVASLSQRPCPLPASAVQRMADDLSLGTTPAEGAKWHGLVPPPPRTPRQANTQPSRPMKRLSPFFENLSPPDKWNAWSKYRLCPVSFQGIREGSARIVHVMLDEHGDRASTAGEVIVLWDLSGLPAAQRVIYPTLPKEVRPYLLSRLRPEDGQVTEIERFEMKVFSDRPATALVPNACVLNPLDGGLAVVRRGKVAYLGESDGLPIGEMHALAWLEGCLYLGGAGALASFAPATKRCELLASSRSVAPRHELDGGGLWNVNTILADADHHCLWVAVDGSQEVLTRADTSRYGLWKLTPGDGALRKVYAGDVGGLSWCDGRVFFYHAGIGNFLYGFHVLDPQTEKIETLPYDVRAYHEPFDFQAPAWTLANGDVFLRKWCILTARGPSYGPLVSASGWVPFYLDYLLRVGPNVLACSLHKQQMWLIQARPPAAAPAAPPRGAPAAIKETAIDLGDGVKLELVSIPAGEFLMGSPESDDNRCEREAPQHLVRITRPFQLGKYPITQQQWQAVMGSNPSFFQGPKNPVEGVSWDGCQRFIGRLNEKLAAGRGSFRLPTEAQWEYACRAGSTTRYCFGNDESELPQYAWCRCASTRNHATQPVGGKKPNAWGLYDMHGNVRQWCADWYDQDYYAESPADDPPGAAKALDRVWRGGDWMATPWSCTSAHRSCGMPMYAYSNVGLRVCLVPAAAAKSSSQLPAAASADTTRPKTRPVKTVSAKDALRAALGELKRRFDFDDNYSASPQHGSAGWRVLVWKDARAAPTWEVLLTDEGEVISVKGEK
jgi:formylglycine-generating enzyme required for sulfatase activity